MMKAKKILSFLMGILLLAVLVAGCGKSGGGEAGASGLAYSQGASDTEIHVGMTYPTSGTWAFIGVPVMDTVKAYIDRCNAQGGIGGRQVIMHHYDDQYDPATGKTLVEKLVEEDKVFLLLGMGGNIVAPCLDYLKEYGIPVVNLTSGLPVLYEEHAPGSAIFPIQPSGATDGRQLVARLLHESLFGPNKDEKLPEGTKIAVFHGTDEGSLHAVDNMKAQAELEGVTDQMIYEVVTAETYATAIQKMKNEGVGALIFYGTDSKGIIAAMDDAGWEVPWMGAYGTSTIQSFVPETYKPGRPCYSTMWADYTTAQAIAALEDINDALTYNTDLDDATRESYKENNYARAGYASVVTMLVGLTRLHENGVDFTWENFVAAMEQDIFDLGAMAPFSYANGVRLGITTMSLVEYYVKEENGVMVGAQANTRGFESIEEIMAK